MAVVRFVSLTFDREMQTPLKLMHFKPTSLINSATVTASSNEASSLPSVVVASFHNAVRDSGEFIVIVVAVCLCIRQDHEKRRKR